MPTGLPNTNLLPVNSETYTSTLSGSIGAMAVTVPVANASPYVDNDVVVLTVDPGLSSQATFVGVKSGSSFINCVWTEGNTGVGHTGGAVIADYDSATHFALVSKAVRVGHNQDGTHKAFTESNIVPTAAIQANAVTGAKIPNATITPDKLATGATQAYVATSESRTNAAYGALTTALATTATIGANGLALVNISVGNMFNNTNGGASYMSFALSGANTQTAADSYAIRVLASGGSVPQVGMGSTFLLTGLTPGSTTFTTQYRSLGSDTATFVDRRISVIPL